MYILNAYIHQTEITFIPTHTYFTQEVVDYGRKKWIRALCQSLQNTKPQCPDLPDSELAYFIMDKTDSFIQESMDKPTPRKCAASVTGLQEPPTWLHPEHQSRTI